MTDKDQIQFYISCAPGLEGVLAGECKSLNLKPVLADKVPGKPVEKTQVEEHGGLLFSGNFEDVYKCNLHLRTASRVTVRLGEFFAAAFSELRKKASRLEWQHYITPGQGVNISVTCHKSKLYHSDAVAERVLGAINDNFPQSKKPIELDKNGQLILVRLVNDLCTISIDSSGTLLHKRGYRQETAKAPIRETLAAGMLLMSGWNASVPLIDPFCGSGTIPIEAALLASHIPPGIARKFTFTRWPVLEKTKWQEILQTARNGITKENLILLGYDRDQGAIRMAESNAARAGMKDVVIFKSQPISELQPSDSKGWIITNPPYGLRTSGNRDLRDLYARFGCYPGAQFKGWNAGNPLLRQTPHREPRVAGTGFFSPPHQRRFADPIPDLQPVNVFHQEFHT